MDDIVLLMSSIFVHLLLFLLVMCFLSNNLCHHNTIACCGTRRGQKIPTIPMVPTYLFVLSRMIDTERSGVAQNNTKKKTMPAIKRRDAELRS